jgi:hypothetical protein
MKARQFGSENTLLLMTPQLQEIDPSTIAGQKPAVCSGLILSGALYPDLKIGVGRRRSIKND